MALGLALALVATQQLALAGIPTDTATHAGARGVARATRAPAGALRMDGRIDEPIWQTASLMTGFTARDPVWGAAPSEHTEARVLYDDEAVYVAVRALDSRADRIDRQLTRRDVGTMSDVIAISIDPHHDRRSAYSFALSAAGVQRDVFRFNDTDLDETWNGVWQSGVTVDSLGWSAEFRIPFSQLRMSSAERHRFGFDVFRRIARTGEWLWWHAPAVGQNGWVSAYGDLEGIEGVRAPRPIEIQPYVLAGADQPAPQAGNPFARSGMARSAGADVRVGLTGGLTLTAALNPDFGQVEADPAVVNLSAVETFLPERRPFFAEGADLFRLGIPSGALSTEALFYSRRIGRAPRLEADARGGYAQTIANTTILGAGKLTGRLAPGWTVGALAALTAEEQAEAADSVGVRHRDVVEPRTIHAVGRLARELRGGQTVLGLFGTLSARNLTTGMDDVRARAYTGGASFEHRFGRDQFHVTGQLVASRVEGSAAAITETQRSSVHYFQRPDNAATVDSSATAMSGVGALLDVGRHAGAWIGGIRYAIRSPGFEVNDLGFQTWAGQGFGRAHVTRRWLRGGRMFNWFQVTGAVTDLRSWEGKRIQGTAELTATMVTRGNWWLESSVWYRNGGRDPMVLRGGPALTVPGNWFVRQLIETDGRKRIWFSMLAGAWRLNEGRYGGWWAITKLTMRPTAGVELQVAPRVDTWDENRAYLATGDRGGTPVYVLGQRNWLVTAVGLRANATLSTRLSAEAYAEPFFSRGRVSAFRTVADPHAKHESGRFATLDDDQLIRRGDQVTADFDRDGTGDLDLGEPDFTVLSLRSNVVVRWEFRSPSALFLVWQHGREREESHAIGLGDGMRSLGNTDGANRLLVKITYWVRVR